MRVNIEAKSIPYPARQRDEGVVSDRTFDDLPPRPNTT
jgi:hypothetical protein